MVASVVVSYPGPEGAGLDPVAESVWEALRDVAEDVSDLCGIFASDGEAFQAYGTGTDWRVRTSRPTGGIVEYVFPPQLLVGCASLVSDGVVCRLDPHGIATTFLLTVTAPFDLMTFESSTSKSFRVSVDADRRHLEFEFKE